MYSPLDSGSTVYPENTVGDGREFLYLNFISATWDDVQSKDHRGDRRVACQNSLVSVQELRTKPGRSRARIVHVPVQNFCISLHTRHSSSISGKLGRSLGAVWHRSGF